MLSIIVIIAFCRMHRKNEQTSNTSQELQLPRKCADIGEQGNNYIKILRKKKNNAPGGSMYNNGNC